MLNPITFTEHVVGDFLRYQLTTYPFADGNLHAQMRHLLNLEETRNSPLFKGPYVSLSRAFAQGAEVQELIRQGILHSHLANLTSYKSVYGHQQKAFEAVHAGKTTLIATGTGSGKTECFLYPIISHCLRLRDEGAVEGVAAVLVYPMNALAEDQLGRLRVLLAGSGVSFGMYVGKTPEKTSDVAGMRLSQGSSRRDYIAAIEKLRNERQSLVVHPPEERVSREQMRSPNSHPRILLTNVKQLELLLTRERDIELFDDADLRFLVFDEAHTLRGAQGGETACLVRRLRHFCRKTAEEVVCIATSATIADPDIGVEAGRDFASRFFGVDTAGVELVGESYEDDSWAANRSVPDPLPGNPTVQLQTVLEAVRDVEGDDVSTEAERSLQLVFQTITGQKLDPVAWKDSLYQKLSENELAYRIAETLRAPRPLSEMVQTLGDQIGRPVHEEEILMWLALGAVSRREGRPLLRPVVHGFVRGMSGAVVAFPEENEGCRLWLSREDAIAEEDVENVLRKLDVTTCTTCGQHYFIHFVDDFNFLDRLPAGGVAAGDTAYWPALDEAYGGNRVVVTDRVVGGVGGEDTDDGELEEAGPPRRTAYVFLCRSCGALHRDGRKVCSSCGRTGDLVRLLAVRQKEANEGYLTQCLACNAPGRSLGGSYREPARPVRAVAVSDVHVLAQNMLQHAERRRLVVFADNRQDAAFQAGWMQDHARRYRMRSLMYERINEGRTSVGDLVAWLDKRLDEDDALSQAIMPEVWRVSRKEMAGEEHSVERRYFLRIQVLREVANGLRQRIGLEPWGRMVVDYLDLDAEHALFRKWAEMAACRPEELLDGVSLLLDIARRSMAVFDRDNEIFSRWWSDGDREVQRGYIVTVQGGPKAITLERGATDNRRLSQWLSQRGETRAVQLAKKWRIPDDRIREFFEELWGVVTGELRLVVPATLKNQWGRVLPDTTGARQVDADRLLLGPNRGLYRCTACRRTQLRGGPHAACFQWRCNGTVEYVEEDPDNYDLKVIDERFALIRAREHSAQVPAEEREKVERIFKGESELVNTVVATPTLELGVDIGSLDAVLMRNVPPLAANYWQRAGRAGRRHRMAVNLAYAGTGAHDRAYFHDPIKLLEGRIDPPRFNMKNEPMVRKHVHAAALSELRQLARPASGLLEEERERIVAALGHAFPDQIKGYLFAANGEVRRDPFDLAPLDQIIDRNRSILSDHVQAVFSTSWPDDDRDVVNAQRMEEYLSEMTDQLGSVVRRLERRLRWAMSQLGRLEEVRARIGALDPVEDALHARCDRLVKKLKGIDRRRRREAEGHDDTNTYSVLSAEGFLPGYGLETGSVIGYYQSPRYAWHLRDFQLPRGLAMALREYSPGNFLYANGHRFYPRQFHFEATSRGDAAEPLSFQVDVPNGAVVDQGVMGNQAAGLTAGFLPAVPICDVDLPHQSHIADDEDYRFQLGVAIFGYEQGRHGGGRSYRWGHRDVQLRRQVHLRLVNVGANQFVRAGQELGYPVCLVCGQSRSPFSSQAERDDFSKSHHERCGRPVRNMGFYADDVADALSFIDCADKTEAYSVTEALRQGAADVLEMEQEDLQILVIGRAGTELVDALLYDPMSGGSGLLDQMVQRWDEVVAAARRMTAECPSQCDVACVDCLLHFRNAWSHAHLDRHVAERRFDAWGQSLQPEHEIPPLLPKAPGGDLPVNEAEEVLKEMLSRAGLPGPTCQHEIDIGMPLGKTVVDFFYEDPGERYEGLCIYLDGLSQTIHGNAEAQRRDSRIREELRANGYEIIVIAASHLTDRAEMTNHFSRIARILIGKEKARSVRDDTSWFLD